MSTTRFTVVDLFCGAGGSTTGAAAVAGAEVTHAFNHWERAIETHAANHPATEAAITDLHEVHPAAFDPMVALLGSPECKTHSNSSGKRRKNLGQIDAFDRCDLSPEDARSRATMWTMLHWASCHRPEFVITENVVEVRMWPEIDAWHREWDRLGYVVQRVCVNAMHIHGLLDERVGFMAPQTRDRVYFVCSKKGNPLPDVQIRPRAYCPTCETEVSSVQSWKDTKLARSKWGKYRRQYVYVCPGCASTVEPWTFAAANAIDWTLTGIRIGDREKLGMKPLSSKTIARIEYGLSKYGLRSYQVADRYSSGVAFRVRGTDEPMFTQPSQPVVGLVETAYTHAPDNRVRPVDDVLSTQSGQASKALVFSNRENGKLRGTDGPMHTATTGQTLGLLTACRTNGKSQPAESWVLPTATAGGTHHGLVTPPGDANLFTQRGSHAMDGLNDPIPTITATCSQTAVLSRHPFLVQYYGTHNASAADEELPTVTTKDRHALVEHAEAQRPVRVEDLFFRMLEPHELMIGTGYPDDYKLFGTKRDRVKLVGNSNYPGVEQVLLQRCLDTLDR